LTFISGLSQTPSTVRSIVREKFGKEAHTMVITGIFHVAIKTADLAGTIKFYRDVLGMRVAPRPNFPTQGAWLACSTPDNSTIIHFYAGDAARDETGGFARGTAAIDHVSLTVVGYRDTVERIKAYGLDWREYVVPDTKLWQIFIYDPNGVQLELTYDSEAESDTFPDVSDARRAVPGANFFDPTLYAGFAAATQREVEPAHS
jgi:catechol 2,3-dioxygenase-like lactoylglutathione lyase family enzyme